jgi:CRISPR-associated protein Csd1
LAEWFQDIEMTDNNGGLSYSPLHWLINATQGDKKPGEEQKADLNSKTRIGTILWNAAIKGHSYKIPLEILQYVLNRIWKKDGFSKERAALIKLVINRNTNKNMKSTLEESNTSVAYLCGRLFAVIESMQWKAIGNVNNGVKERYFAAAASQPTILGMLLTKNVPIYQHKIGGYLAKELNEIAGRISEIGSFPQRFSTIEQGEFALGYYFQRNHKKETTDNIN